MLTLFALILFAILPLQPQDPAHAPTPPPETSQQDILADLRQRNIEIEFTGNKVFSNQALLDLLARDAPQALRYLTEDVKDTEKMDYGLRLLRNCLAAQGYLRAKASQPTVAPITGGHRLIVPLHEGARYRVGQIRITGAKVLTTEQVREAIALKEGDIASGEQIYRAIYEKLKQAYEDKGYIQFAAEAEPTFHRPSAGKDDGIVDFDITIDEGRFFTVQSIEFANNNIVPDEVLRPAIRLQVGQTYSTKLMEESLNNLNDLGLFALLDKDRDVDFKQDEETGQLKIIIKLRERGQP